MPKKKPSERIEEIVELMEKNKEFKEYVRVEKVAIAIVIYLDEQEET